MLLLSGALAQPDHRIDVQRADAPELAAFGGQAVGVRTLEVSDPWRFDILGTIRGAAAPRYDRSLTLEVWYPAALPEGTVEGGTYEVVTRDGTIAQLAGRAVRDAEPAVAGGPYPLVVLSHGETWAAGTFGHYAESVWDTVRMNNVKRHVVTAFFGLHLKGDEAMAPYLDLVEDAVAGVWSVDDAGVATADHTYWPGFQQRTALGLRFERGVPATE